MSRAEPRPLRLLGGVLFVAIALGACGAEDPGVPSPPTGDPGHPIVLQFHTGGGIAGPCCDPWEVPNITAYRDGRVVLTDGVSGQFPDVREAMVDRSALGELLADARDAGLLEASDFGAVCCDMAYTRVVIADGATAHEFEVTGLGHEDGSDLSSEQVRLRGAVADLQERLVALAEQSPNQHAYAPAALAVYVSPSEETGPATPWPLDRSLADGGTPVAGNDDGRCLLVTDADVIGSVRTAASEAADPMWSSDGRVWWVRLRPLLPYEDGCPQAVVS